jgi:hypothetical protein
MNVIGPDGKVIFDPSVPRNRREAWQRHLSWIALEVKKHPEREAVYAMMLARQRDDYEAGRFPWGQYPEEGRPSDYKIRTAIGDCIKENDGRHIGEERLWRQVQDKFPGCDVPRKAVRELMPKVSRGRPRKNQI